MVPWRVRWACTKWHVHYSFNVMPDLFRALQNLIHPVEFPLCGAPFGGFHRAGFCHPNEEGGLFWGDWCKGAVFLQRISGGNRRPQYALGQCGGGKTPPQIRCWKDQPESLGTEEKPISSLRKYELCKALVLYNLDRRLKAVSESFLKGGLPNLIILIIWDDYIQ